MSKGLSGSLRLIAMLAVLLLAMLAVTALFGWLPAEELRDVAIKGLATLALVAVVALALGALLGRNE